VVPVHEDVFLKSQWTSKRIAFKLSQSPRQYHSGKTEDVYNKMYLWLVR